MFVLTVGAAEVAPNFLFRSFKGMGVKLDNAAGIVDGNAFGGIRTDCGGSSEAGIGAVGSGGSFGWARGESDTLGASFGRFKDFRLAAANWRALEISLLDFFSRFLSRSSLYAETGLDSFTSSFVLSRRRFLLFCAFSALTLRFFS